MTERPHRLTKTDLAAMRKEFGPRQSLYTLEDDLEQVRLVGQLGLDLSEWADSCGAKRKYAQALRQYLEQELLWDPPEDHFEA